MHIFLNSRVSLTRLISHYGYASLGFEMIIEYLRWEGFVTLYSQGATGRQPPPPLGILCHYDFLILWGLGHLGKKVCKKIFARQRFAAILPLFGSKNHLF